MGPEEETNQPSWTQGAIDAEKAVAEAVNKVIQQQEEAVREANQLIVAAIESAKKEIDASIQAMESAVQNAVAATQKAIHPISEPTNQGPPPQGDQR